MKPPLSPFEKGGSLNSWVNNVICLFNDEEVN